MKVRIKSIVAGPEWSFRPGQIADLPDESAQALIDGGYAEVVKPAAPVETAMATSAPSDAARVDVGDLGAPPETAVVPEASPDEARVDVGEQPDQAAPADEAMGAGDEEKPTRRGRSRK